MTLTAVTANFFVLNADSLQCSTLPSAVARPSVVRETEKAMRSTAQRFPPFCLWNMEENAIEHSRDGTQFI